MKHLIILLTLVAVSFSSEKWEYLLGEWTKGTFFKYEEEKILNKENFIVYDGIKSEYDIDIGDSEYQYYGYGLQKSLQLIGKDGWELVNVLLVDETDVDIGDRASKDSKTYHYYFKRKID